MTTGSGTGSTRPTAAGRRPRLLVLASTYPSAVDDGTPGFVRDLVVEQSRHFDTMVVVPRVPGSRARETNGQVQLRRFRFFPSRWEDLAHGAILENVRSRRSRLLQVPCLMVAEVLAVRRAVREHRPDVMHVHWIVPQGLVALVAARRVPWLLTTLGGDVYALNDPVSRRLKSAVLRRAAVVTGMNSDMVRRLVTLGAPADATTVLPMGADITTVREQAAGEQRVPGRIVFAGRLVEKKGLTVLLAALRRVPDGTWSLDVVGDGPLRGQLTAQAAGLPVRFLGPLPRAELSRVYARSEVVAVPSVPAVSGDQDGLPVVLLEAMSVGCAVIASRLPGIDSAVTDGVSGILVPPGDVAALTAAVVELLADPDRRAALGAAAAQQSENFSVASVGQRYSQLLLDMLPAGWSGRDAGAQPGPTADGTLSA